ncbi:N-acetylneuraminate synthase family protein [SAR116 cluster bacterium]|nr:N-acetylneuraminate synthase family protein [SAR116 cluster bacterium]
MTELGTHFSNRFILGERAIGIGEPAFIIAEVSQNHCGDVDLAKKHVDAAKNAGCDCVKFQTFTAEEMCADREKLFTYWSQGKEVTETEFELHKRYEFGENQWKEIVTYCDEVGIPFMTTVQDPVNLDVMLRVGINAIKVGSDDFDHLRNFTAYAKANLPIITSKGMADLADVDRTIRHMRGITDKLVVMHCVSIYPAAASDLNLRQIKTLSDLYPDVIWGFSDHSMGTLAATSAVALGAKVIEKHFTLDHDLPGPDHWFSLDPKEMKDMVQSIRFVETALGSGDVMPAPGESEEREIRRRRIVVKKDIGAGERLTEENVSFKRASSGLFVQDWDIIVDSVAKHDLVKDQTVHLSDLNFLPEKNDLNC